MKNAAIINGLVWHFDRTEPLGLIPDFISGYVNKSARDQLHAAYAHGGGWRPFEGFALNRPALISNWNLTYPGDRPMKLLGYTNLGHEFVLVFEYSWVCIMALGGDYEIARMD